MPILYRSYQVESRWYRPRSWPSEFPSPALSRVQHKWVHRPQATTLEVKERCRQRDTPKGGSYHRQRFPFPGVSSSRTTFGVVEMSDGSLRSVVVKVEQHKYLHQYFRTDPSSPPFCLRWGTFRSKIFSCTLVFTTTPITARSVRRCP